MRFLILLFSFLFLFSCTNHSENKPIDKRQLLLQGEWRLVQSDKPFKIFRVGMKFSEDSHVFAIDSQGHTIPPTHEIEYSIQEDTLKIVDYKYDVNTIYEKGTIIFIIKEISQDKLVLEMLHPDTPNQLIFEDLK
ncbi:MAG: hypothetical protein H3C31_00100 [Brumimicrobium sp.]|nr:hypothetical protein [Brumimicrobium sp.]